MFKKVILMAAVSAVAALSLTSSASAFGKVYTWGDCTINVSVYPNGSNAEGSANVTCTRRHDTTATLVLKKNGALAAAQTAGPFVNSFGMGSRTLIVYTLNGRGPCNYYQAVLTLTISGLGTASVTSGSPDMICT